MSASESNSHTSSSVEVSLGRLDVVDGNLDLLSDELLSKEPVSDEREGKARSAKRDATERKERERTP